MQHQHNWPMPCLHSHSICLCHPRILPSSSFPSPAFVLPGCAFSWVRAPVCLPFSPEHLQHLYASSFGKYRVAASPLPHLHPCSFRRSHWCMCCALNASRVRSFSPGSPSGGGGFSPSYTELHLFSSSLPSKPPALPSLRILAHSWHTHLRLKRLYIVAPSPVPQSHSSP